MFSSKSDNFGLKKEISTFPADVLVRAYAICLDHVWFSMVG